MCGKLWATVEFAPSPKRTIQAIRFGIGNHAGGPAGPTSGVMMPLPPPKNVACPNCQAPAKVYPTLPSHIHCPMCGLVEITMSMLGA